MKSRSNVSLDTITAILNTYGNILSAEWLMLGNGPMLKSEIIDQSNNRTTKLLDTIGELQSIIEEQRAELDQLKKQSKFK